MQRWATRRWRVLPHADDNQGSVVSEGAVLPCVDAIEDGPLHLRQRLLRGLSYDTAQPIDAQFLLLRVEAFAEAVRVDDHAIAGLKLDLSRRVAVDCFFEQSKSATLRFQQSRLLTGPRNHYRWVSGSGEYQRASVSIQPHSCEREIELAAKGLQHEAVELPEHRREFRAALHEVNDLGVNTIRYQRRADAMPGHVGNQRIEAIAAQSHEPKISTDRSGRLIMRFHRAAVPNQPLRHQRFLYLRGEYQLFFNFPAALFQQAIRSAQVRLRLLALGNIDDSSFNHLRRLITALDEGRVFKNPNGRVVLTSKTVLEAAEYLVIPERC